MYTTIAQPPDMFSSYVKPENHLLLRQHYADLIYTFDAICSVVIYLRSYAISSLRTTRRGTYQQIKS
jgi:hypothetical protein